MTRILHTLQQRGQHTSQKNVSLFDSYFICHFACPLVAVLITGGLYGAGNTSELYLPSSGASCRLPDLLNSRDNKFLDKFSRLSTLKSNSLMLGTITPRMTHFSVEAGTQVTPVCSGDQESVSTLHLLYFQPKCHPI